MAYQGCDLGKRKLKGAQFSEIHGGRQMMSIRKLRLSCHQNAKKSAKGHRAPLENSPAYSNPHEYMSVLAFTGYTQPVEL